VFDVWGEKDFPSVLRDDWRRRLALNSVPGSEQKVIAGADHYFAGRERELTAALLEFMARVP
jgi:alpha/beta superfamily hydrolase